MFVSRQQVNTATMMTIRNDIKRTLVEKTNAIEALKTGLSNLHELVAHVRETYDQELKKETFTRFEEIA
jgi:DNA-directed RNA polymerase I and III subunit RPAC2